MHIPSKRVYDEMRSEAASLWVVPANDGDELAVLIKAPSSSIKALIAGCSVELIFGKVDNYICNGIRIHDMPDAPILISGVQRDIEEHHALTCLLEEKTAPVFIFNEMDVCLAWTNIIINEDHAQNTLNFLGDSSGFYIGDFNNECSCALDSFCYSTDPIQKYPNASLIPLNIIKPTLEPWRTNNNCFIGARESHSININDTNEGEIFERAIWASLESIIPLNIYKSPQVEIGEKIRELTDVFAFHESGCILVESKDLSVLQAGYERDQQRRTNGVQKQILKAIKQLVGASNAVSRGNKVLDASGNLLNIVRDKPSHCIILITEMMHWGDWRKVELEIMKAMQSTGSFFNLLDLSEFITLLKGSSGKIELLDYNLIERCKSFVENGSVHIRTQITPNKTLQSTPKSGATEL